ncbi:MAG: YeeE/YedE family protein [Deltaproteobacteria bacterium]|nr:YeeE/YedE family protein [Deltaproteobacteria bacterium]
MTEVVVIDAWLGGLAIGLYGVAQLLLTGKQLGVSSGYGSICALGSRADYFRSGSHAVRNDWRLYFLLGIPLGGLLAALTSEGPIVASLSLGPLYDRVFPQALWAKAALLFAGGTAMGYGSRLAGGCTSGHVITGVALLNWPSMVAGGCFFLGGIAAVQLLFRALG